MLRLTQAPYNLALGDSIDAKVIAVNQLGETPFSAIGTGAIIQLVPDTPINFANDPAITNEAEIGMTWSPGASDGGTAVLEYRIYFSEESELEDSLLVDELTATSFTTTLDLVSGATYKFKV